MARSRRTPPPFQVMSRSKLAGLVGEREHGDRAEGSSTGRAKSAAAARGGRGRRSADARASLDEQRPAAPHAAGLEGWVDRLLRPIELRVPVVVVGIVVVALLAVLVAAFITGRDMGKGAGRDGAIQEMNVAINALRPGAEPFDVRSILAKARDQAGHRSGPASLSGTQTVGGGNSAGQDGADNSSRHGPRRVDDGFDPRTPGLNYYVLATYRTGAEDYAERLLGFLWARGVEAVGIRGDNSSSVQVVALRGFAREQIGEATDEYRQELLELGREWKTRFRGGDDLSSMYLDRYDGHPAAFVMTKENVR